MVWCVKNVDIMYIYQKAMCFKNEKKRATHQSTCKLVKDLLSYNEFNCG